MTLRIRRAPVFVFLEVRGRSTFIKHTAVYTCGNTIISGLFILYRFSRCTEQTKKLNKKTKNFDRRIVICFHPSCVRACNAQVPNIKLLVFRRPTIFFFPPCFLYARTDNGYRCEQYNIILYPRDGS